MSAEPTKLLTKLDTLAKKLEILTLVTALDKRLDKLLVGKNQAEQIQILRKWDIPNEVIAIIVGTTPDVVAVRLSQLKSKGKKKKQKLEESGKEQQ